MKFTWTKISDNLEKCRVEFGKISFDTFHENRVRYDGVCYLSQSKFETDMRNIIEDWAREYEIAEREK